MIKQSTDHIVVGAYGTTVEKWSEKIYLKDGGAALFINGELKSAVSEERINRNKHSSGFEKSINYCLDQFNLKESDIDLIALSNCCDYPHQPNTTKKDGIICRNLDKVKIVDSHHESHAILAALQSGFKECIVLVADNEGNLLNDNTDINNYWNNSLERVSIYLFKEGALQLLERNCEEPYNIGLGDTYHYFTHYLGWKSYTQAGRVMGLSAYGNRDIYKSHPIFTLDNSGRINSNIKNDRPNKLNSILQYGQLFDVKFPGPRECKQEITKEYMDIACWIQCELEKIVSVKIQEVVSKFDIHNVCIAGGIGYNCLANRAVLELNEVDNIFVSYAPGDEGQPIGNGILALLDSYRIDQITIGKTPFLGKIYSEGEIKKCLLSDTSLKWDYFENIENKAANLISEQNIIGWFQGHSEMGSRALGNRCILADPRFYENKNKVNAMKNREWYRPIAPSVLAEYQDDYFDLDIYVPYMNIALKVRDEMQKIIPVVTHKDGSSRIHTVREEDNAIYFNLINEFHKITGVPVLANTSFNKNGQSIVETPSDAISAFKCMGLDFLILGNYLIYKQHGR